MKPKFYVVNGTIHNSARSAARHIATLVSPQGNAINVDLHCGDRHESNHWFEGIVKRDTAELSRHMRELERNVPCD